MEKQLRFEELKVGMKVRFEHIEARKGPAPEDEEKGGEGIVRQITPHLVVFWNGKYHATGTRIEMLQGRLSVWKRD